MKKILSVAIAAAALGSAADAKGFNGFYAGLDFGLNQTSSKFTGAIDTGNIFLYSGNGHGSNSNLGIFLGYNKVFTNCISLGAEYESDFNFGSKHTLESTQSRKATAERATHSWSTLLKTGVLVNPKTLFFVGLGVKSMKSHLDYAQPGFPTASVKIKTNKVRFTSQIGFENLVASDKVALRMTYGFTKGAKKTVRVTTTANVFGPGFMSYKADEHLVKLGISYRF